MSDQDPRAAYTGTEEVPDSPRLAADLTRDAGFVGDYPEPPTPENTPADTQKP